MNILLVSSAPLNSNSGNHVYNLASQLTALGALCVVAVPAKPDVDVINIKVVSFSDALELVKSKRFDLIHAWTPREHVRILTTQLLEQCECPYFVHLEDNEEVILEASLGYPFSELQELPKRYLDEIVPGYLSHPINYKKFIRGAQGMTVIMDTLQEFCPSDIPTEMIWPGFDDCEWRLPMDMKLRRRLGIADGDNVLVYTGNVHRANQKEVASLYLAVGILNRKGVPTKLVRTGHNQYPFLAEEMDRILQKYYIDVGWVDRSELPALLSIADALVQPGNSDKFNDYRFPSKIPEYLASGKPVLLPRTNIGNFLKDGEECFLLSRGDAIEISERLAELFSNKELGEKVGLGGAKFADENLRWEDSAKKLAEFYTNVLSSAKKKASIPLRVEQEIIEGKPKDVLSEIDQEILELKEDRLELKQELQYLNNRFLQQAQALADKSVMLAELETQIVERNIQIAELHTALHNIQISKSWRLMMALGKLRMSLVPPNSLRERFSRKLFLLFINLYRFLKLAKNNGIKFALKRENYIFREQEVAYTEKNFIADWLSQCSQVENGYIFISHDASATGAPINLLNQCKAFKKEYGDDFVIVSVAGGVLLEEFQSVGETICLCRTIVNIVVDEEIDTLFSGLKDLGYSNCIANTVISGAFRDVLDKNYIETVYEIHELPGLILTSGFVSYAKNIAESNSSIICAANYVAEKFVENYGASKESIHIIPQGVRDSMVYEGTVEAAKEKLVDLLNISLAPDLKFVLGVGYAHKPKGTDLFLDVAEKILKLRNTENIHFVWLGERDQFFEFWKEKELPKLSYRENIHLLDYQSDPAYIFSAADLFLLTSREDSFPSVALESLVNNTPVLMFENTGGIEEILDGENGKAVPHLDTQAMALEAINILDAPKKDTLLTEKLNTYPIFIKKVVSLLQEKRNSFWEAHKVSVVVPNYNYEKYLDERLESILNQTYKPAEIIFLDDVSSDNSVEVAKEILQSSDIPHTIIANQENQGTFAQWLRGIQEAKHDYLWIAEADDFASRDFLDTIIHAFQDKDIVLAYCQPKQVDENSEPYSEYHYTGYVGDLSENKWTANYQEEGVFEVENYLAIKNTIPNVSGVVIKKEALKGLDAHLAKYKYAGDWFTYLYALKSGKIAYFSRIMNFHRRHRKSIITAGDGALNFFKEIVQIYDYITDNFTINMRVMDMMESNLRGERNAERAEEIIQEAFANLRVKNRKMIAKKIPLNIMIVLAEFQLGGGEITGLRLANYLAKEHNVYLCAAKPEYNEQFLEMVNPQINLVGYDPSQFTALIHSGEIDIVNSHIWWADKLAYAALKDNHIFWILSMHGCSEMLIDNPNVDRDFSELYPKMYERANFITYDTEKNLKVLKGLKKDKLLSKTRHVYHGFEGGSLQNPLSKEDLGFDTKSFVFVFVARGIKEKGWGEAIEAAISLKNAGHNISLILIGDSEYVQKLREKYAALGFINFVGKQSNLIDYFQIADVGLLPSYFVSESQPLTIIEYLAAGLPVISTDIGEIKNMLYLDEAQAGIVLPFSKGKTLQSALEKAMESLLLDKEYYTRLQETTKKIFDAKFDIEKFAQAYLSLYVD